MCTQTSAAPLSVTLTDVVLSFSNNDNFILQDQRKLLFEYIKSAGEADIYHILGTITIIYGLRLIHIIRSMNQGSSVLE